MDAETKQYFDDKFTAFAQHILHEVFHEMDLRFATVDAKLESIDARLKLQAGLIQSGARAMARFSEFSEASELRQLDLAGRYENLERRVTKLESKQQHSGYLLVSIPSLFSSSP